MSPYSLPSSKELKLLEGRGPWKTKSNGELNVLFGLSYDDVQTGFFQYDPDEIRFLPRDIRGLRSYRVSGLGKDAIGANEWHRVRNELLFVTNGSAELTCEDAYRNISTYNIVRSAGVWIPPFILHTYKALEEGTELLVIANTSFFPEDPATHDTYTAKSFKDLQDELSASKA